MKSTAVLQGPRDRRLRSLGLQIQATKCSMSALPSTAEIYQGDGHVRFVPTADIPCATRGSFQQEVPDAKVLAGLGQFPNWTSAIGGSDGLGPYRAFRSLFES